MQIQSGDVFVRRTGDIMTGQLRINGTGVVPLVLDASGGGPLQMLQFLNAGVLKYAIRMQNADPFLTISDVGVVDRFSLNLSNGVIGTAQMPMTGIGVSGSGTANGIAAGAVGNIIAIPGITTGTNFGAYTVRNSVALANDGVGFSSPQDQTDFKQGYLTINSDLTTTMNIVTNIGGQMGLAAKNTNAAVANLTFNWSFVGR